jgi:C-terminal processing protease CtpA/Prc
VRLAASVHPPEQRGYARPYRGRLYIMTDARTASASEQFAALLIDNGVARTIGEKTMGVGCGFTNGGNPTTLKHSGLVIWMPDCARLRADGSNEFEGVAPDYPVAWGDDAAGTTAALLQALDRLPKP